MPLHLENIPPFLEMWLRTRLAPEFTGLSMADLHLMAYYSVIGLIILGRDIPPEIKTRITKSIMSSIRYDSDGIMLGMCFEDKVVFRGIHIVDTQLSLQILHLLHQEKFSTFISENDGIAIIRSILRLYDKTSGTFRETDDEFSQRDSKFTYASLVIIDCLLEHTKAINQDVHNELARCYTAVYEQMRGLWNLDGGAAFTKGTESHLAATYLNLASTLIMQKHNMIEVATHSSIPYPELTSLWVTKLIYQGLPSRPCKDGCSCYMFWGLGAVRMMNELYKNVIPFGGIAKFIIKYIEGEQAWLPLTEFVRIVSLFNGKMPDMSSHKIMLSLDEIRKEPEFGDVLSCIDHYGFKFERSDVTGFLYCGFCKHGAPFPDPYHTTAVLQGLSYLGYNGLKSISPSSGLPL